MELVHRTTKERVPVTDGQLREILAERSEKMRMERSGQMVERLLLSDSLHWYTADIWDIEGG